MNYPVKGYRTRQARELGRPGFQRLPSYLGQQSLNQARERAALQRLLQRPFGRERLYKPPSVPLIARSARRALPLFGWPGRLAGSLAELFSLFDGLEPASSEKTYEVDGWWQCFQTVCSQWEPIETYLAATNNDIEAFCDTNQNANSDCTGGTTLNGTSLSTPVQAGINTLLLLGQQSGTQRKIVTRIARSTPLVEPTLYEGPRRRVVYIQPQRLRRTPSEGGNGPPRERYVKRLLPSQPGPGVKERKGVRLMGPFHGRGVLEFATEVDDVLDCLYEALPAYDRFNTRHSSTRMDDKFMAVYRNPGGIDVGKALACITREQGEDALRGRLGSLAGRGAMDAGLPFAPGSYSWAVRQDDRRPRVTRPSKPGSPHDHRPWWFR